MTIRQKIRQFLCAVFAFAVCWAVSGWISPAYERITYFVAPLWNKVSEIRVDSETTAVTIDREVRRLWFDGEVTNSSGLTGPGYMAEAVVTIRQVGSLANVGTMTDNGQIVTSCNGGRPRIPYLAGQAYQKVIGTTGIIRTLAWFLESPPKEGCTLVPGGYVADFQWKRKWLFFTLYTPPISSQIFIMSKTLDMDAIPQ